MQPQLTWFNSKHRLLEKYEMFIKRRVEFVKEFKSRERAEGFASGLEFSGVRDYRVLSLEEKEGKFLLTLEKLEKAKV